MMNCRACRRASSRSSWTPAARARSNASGEVLKRVNELVYSGVKAPVVGVCRLATKTGATQLPRELGAGHTRRVKAKGVPVVVYEPTLDAPEFFGSEVTHDLEAFKAGCDVIVANRWSDELADVADKVYTMDLFKRFQCDGGKSR